MTTLIDGKAIAQDVRNEIRDEVAAWVADGHEPPGLATVLVGDDAASAVYVGGKQKACAEVGIRGLRPPARRGRVRARRCASCCTPSTPIPRSAASCSSCPTPKPIDGPRLTTEIAPGKDVDGLTPISTGLLAKNLPGLRPCTPLGCMELLRRHEVNLEGAEAVVVGRSDLVGKPISALLLQANATVTTAHSRTRDLAEVCRRADVLIAAVGVAHLIKGDWVKEGAAVIDVGMNRVDGKLTGDVEFEAARERAALITPVPGGVGPMTIAMLMRNTLEAAKAA